MPNVNSLEYQRTLQKQEKAVELVDIWAAILDAGEAIKALGGSYPDEHIRKAQDALLRAGKLATGDLTDDVIKEIATVGTARIWAANMGQVFAGETIIDGTSGETYICTVMHQAQALYAPGTEGGRTLFRLIREEPEEPGTYLDFAWGEHVPYGAVRRDPIDGKLYTPIKEAGVTLYEPHYPHLVPSEYKLYEDGGEEPEPGPEPEPEPGDVPDWDDLEEGHTFAVGDHFTHDGTEYEVLRAFNKQENWAPPALLNDYYKVASPRKRGPMITINLAEALLAFIAAMGVPGAIMGLVVWKLERRISKRESEAEQHEKSQKDLLALLVESTSASIALGEATAKAVQRIPDAHCNGDMKGALEYATTVKHRQKEFLTETGRRCPNGLRGNSRGVQGKAGQRARAPPVGVQEEAGGLGRLHSHRCGGGFLRPCLQG